jgi:hypothetical protein
MYHHTPRQSAPLTAASVFGPILGELPESVRLAHLHLQGAQLIEAHRPHSVH